MVWFTAYGTNMTIYNIRYGRNLSTSNLDWYKYSHRVKSYRFLNINQSLPFICFCGLSFVCHVQDIITLVHLNFWIYGNLFQTSSQGLIDSDLRRSKSVLCLDIIFLNMTPHPCGNILFNGAIFGISKTL